MLEMKSLADSTPLQSQIAGQVCETAGEQPAIADKRQMIERRQPKTEPYRQGNGRSLPSIS
jgi:hypothetical protein